jgi:hypothetical protein
MKARGSDDHHALLHLNEYANKYNCENEHFQNKLIVMDVRKFSLRSTKMTFSKRFSLNFIMRSHTHTENRVHNNK